MNYITDETVSDAEEFLDHGTGDERAAGALSFAANPVLIRVSLEEWRDGQPHTAEPPREVSP
jgi:hypothetical protein